MTEHHIPQHIGIIMDGNNRWAKVRGKRKLAGHAAGADSLRSVTRKCVERGVYTLSIFAFSSENWNRPKLEVDGLMRLFERSLIDELPDLIENDISVEVIGDRSRFVSSLKDAIERAEVATAKCNRLKLNILANYGGRWDIAETAKRLAAEVLSGQLPLEAIDEYLFDDCHNLAGQPSVDLLIRTGGERRISNFLLWQSAYAELIFTDILWPDFDGKALETCLLEYAGRERRFGKTSEQVRIF
ncbi:MAG: di-trans,poly-cis-decaprenylcistransferase [Gammaproteobacteria bacterium]|nr:di-trans,poly-cis-decaprenylcistransferase [Gammaproteobacteria bacterium]|tara:strand:+ start:665 stop:1393 length:729 start_codon:yes stop_codon:yes gene_type:complete